MNFSGLVSQPFRSIMIYGMGMMGTSLALAIRQASPRSRICGVVRSENSVEYLKSLKVVDSIIVNAYATETASIPYDAYELLVFCIPIKQTIELIPRLPPMQTLITDISSTQAELQTAFQAHPNLRFISSHPLCGSEKNGSRAALPDLYKDRLCLLSAVRSRQADLVVVERFWRSLGMQTYIFSAKSHDQALAYLSHGPHLIAGLMCLWADKNKAVRSLSARASVPPGGGGFRDMARIAGSNPEMWADIIKTNSNNLVPALKEFEKEISTLIRVLKKNDYSHWFHWFKKVRKLRDKLSSYP